MKRPESHDKLLSLVKRFKSRREAARELGIPETTLRSWVKNKEIYEQSLKKQSVYKEFTKDDIEAAIEKGEGIPGAAEILGVNERRIREWRAGKGRYGHLYTGSDVPLAKPKIKPLHDYCPDSNLNLEYIKSFSRFVITSAQNNADIHEPFFKSLQRYCEFNNALLLVIPVRYKNVTAYISGDDYQVQWPMELAEHYLNHELVLNKNLVILGDFKIQATARSPLSGVKAYAKTRSAIIGHPQIELEMVPSPLDDLPRKLITTGSISKKHYSSSKVGMLANFHHSYGATIVETDGDLFWTRQINALEDGSFYDFDTEYYADKSPNVGNRAAGLVLGDVHVEFVDPAVVSGTFTAPNSLYNICQPENVYLHDVLDFHSANHHHMRDIYTKYAKHHAGVSGVQAELDRVVQFHNSFCGNSKSQWHYISSNHHDALTRWLNDADPKQDPENALFYHKMMVYMLENTKMGPNGTEVPNPMEHYMMSRIWNPEHTFFHPRGKKLMLFDIDLSQHGDAGPNGARGTLNTFANSGYKTVTGHGHAPGIKQGAYRVGTSSLLRLSYNQKGYSSWFQTHCLIYPNGKRSLVDIINGRCRA